MMVGATLSKRLQLLTILPLIVGIIICAVVSVSIMFVDHFNWLLDSKQDLISTQIENLQNNSRSFSESFSILMNTITLDLIFISQVYSGVYSGTLTSTPTDQTNLIRFENSSATDLSVSVWYSKSINHFSSISEREQNALNATNSFLSGIYSILIRTPSSTLKSPISLQLGIVLKDGIDYRYPAINMSSVLKCSNQVFDPLKTQSYSLRSSKNISITNECGTFLISINFTYGTVTCYMPASILAGLLKSGIEYLTDTETYFVAYSDFSSVIFLSTTANYSNTLCENLFPNDIKLVQVCSETNGVNLGTVNNLTLEGYNTFILASYSPVLISASVRTDSLTDMSSFTAGCLVNKQETLLSWNQLIDNIFDIIIIQMAIFILFIIVTIYLSWKLSGEITRRITVPIYVIGKMLKNKASEEEQKGEYNKEVNKVIEDLKLLSILEKFIDPHFLLHPEYDVRIENLEKANELFTKIGNFRGMAITQNLIGNAYFARKEYKEAETAYEKALSNTQSLFQALMKHEKKERKLSGSESSKKETKKKDWDEEKAYLKENIVERKQQLCMALEAQLQRNSEDLNSVKRNDLKKIKQFQVEILEYYVSTRTHYIRLVKVLLDMAKIFQYLQYYHSGLQLLDIVKDELIKIRSDQVFEVDIDITRLKSIGINIKFDDSISQSRHFSLGNVICEKDILMQHMFYRRGMILLDSDKPQEAGHALTSAIEHGQFFDPYIRKKAVESLCKMMKDFDLMDHAKDLHEIHNKINSAEKSLLFVLIYDLKKESQVNIALMNYFKEELSSPIYKIGILTEHSYNKQKLDVVQRDMPDVDLESLLIQSESPPDSIALYDTLIRAVDEFHDDGTERVVILILNAQRQSKGAAHIENFKRFQEEKIKLVVICEYEIIDAELVNYFKSEEIHMIYLHRFSEIYTRIQDLTSLI